MLMVGAFLSLSVGGQYIAPADVLHHIWATLSGQQSMLDHGQMMILDHLRIPRIVLGLAVGAGLGMAGAVLQGVFRNPLMDPGLIGVSSGAALGAVTLIVLGDRLAAEFTTQFGVFSLPLAAFTGGSFATLVIFILSRQQGGTDVTLMLLVGIAINAFCGAGLGILTYIADDAQLRSLTFWSMGSLSYAGAASWVAIAIISVACLCLATMGQALNIFSLGEADASHLGLPTERLKWMAALLAAAAVGAAVAVCGMIGFIGLIAPHLVRQITGGDYRYILPGAMICGAGLLTAADAIARTLVLPAELPIGLMTSVIGGPAFLILLLTAYRKKSRAF
jgi:iron complex transport system permease protein